MKKDEYFFTYPEFNNIREIVMNSVNKFPNNRAFILKDKEGNLYNKTYAEFIKEVKDLATGLYDLGLKDKRIAIIGKNSYTWALGYITCLLGGFIAVPLDKDLEFGELEESLIRSKTDAIIFDEKRTEFMEKIKLDKKTNVKLFISEADVIEIQKAGEKLVNAGSKQFDNVEIDSEAMSILLFTSGTTSKSKAVMLSQKNIASNIVSMRYTEEFKETDVNLAFLPFHHTFGSTAMLMLLSAGAANAFPDGLRYVAQNLKEYKVTFFIGVPLLIESIYKKVQKEIEKQGKTKLINVARKVTNFLDKIGIHVKRKVFKPIIDNLGGELRFIISGAASLDKNVSKFFNEIGIKTLQGYGLTEASPVISAENCKYIKYGSVGFPMKDVTVEVVNKDEQGIGEIRAKGPNIMLGYYENEKATNDVLKDGWFYTGDYGYIDPEGFVFITGRKKNMIVLKNGKKIFPEEVEELVNKIDLVKESMVFGMPKGDDVVVSVKVQYDEEIAKEKYSNKSFEELEKIVWDKIKEMNKTLPTYKYVKNLFMTKDDFIKTTTAKIKRFEEFNKIMANQH